MKKELVLAAFVGTIVFGPVNVARAADPATEKPVVAQKNVSTDVEVSLTKEKQEIQVTKGARLKVSVEGNPTTGFTWEIEDFKPSLLEFDGNDVCLTV